MASLVVAAQAGDQHAFGQLYERFAGYVHGIMLAIAEPDDVPDLVQDVFMLVMQRIRDLRDPMAFGSWLATIARNCALAHRRRVRPSVQLTDSLAAPQALDTEGREAFAALRTLPETYREPLVLRLVEGLSGPEIADRLGLTHGTVRVYLHRGLEMLRERLGGTRD